MSATEGTAHPPRSLTPFQFQCTSEVARLLRERDFSFRREQVEGEEENYLIFNVESNAPRPLKVYVYEDEAGFFLGERWHVWETQDYEEPQELMSAFLEGLRSAIDVLRKEPPAADEEH